MAEKTSSVKDFYGKRLESSADLKVTSVIQCTRKTVRLPPFIKEALSSVHEDILAREYGCATSYPEVLEGANALDLGSGCGRDCFVLSNVVGEGGKVVGLDMTDELLELAQDKVAYHTEKYGYKQPNVRFVKGYMEKMEQAGLEEGFFDIIVSNCVISLCRDKQAVLRQAHRVLKVGGEMFFSDMYRNGTLPEDVMDDENLWCEGLIGSLTYKDLHQIASDIGFTAPRLVKADTIPVVDQKVKARLGDVTYASVTYRLFKKPAQGNDAQAPEIGQVTYKGGIRGCEEVFEFDHALKFQKGVPKTVSGELLEILTMSRFSQYFDTSAVIDGEKAKEDVVDVDPFALIQQNGAKQPCNLEI